MNHRTAYIRNSRKAQRIKKRIAGVAMLAVAACAAALMARAPAPDPRPAAQVAKSAPPAAPAPAQAVQPAPAAPAQGGPRRIYPYSIVPGGVSGRAELAHIVQTDKVVAAHYAAFDLARAHTVAVARPRAVHVSYRKGDKVYWTANKVMLAEGETLLSDGRSEIRGRCGNRISDVALLPIEAGAPGEEELDAAVEVAQDGAASGGALQVSYAVDGDGGSHQSHQLLSYPNGAGMLALSGGAAWHAPAGQLGAGAGASGYAGRNAAPALTLVSAAGRHTETGGTVAAPAAGSAAGAAADPGTSGAGPRTVSATSGGVPIETPRTAGSVPATAPSPAGATGPAAVAELPAGLPAALADTVQPALAAEPDMPAIPDTLLWPQDLASVPVKPAPAPASAEAPEPPTLWLGGVGLAAMLLRRRRRAS